MGVGVFYSKSTAQKLVTTSSCCSPIRYNIPYGPVTPNRGFFSRVHDIHEKLFPETFIVTFVVSL
jgi:hypothetical protein